MRVVKTNIIRALLLLWVVGIGFMSFYPSLSKEIPFLVPLHMFMLHSAAFFVLLFLLFFSLPLKGASFPLRLIVIFIVTMAISVFKEIGQIGIVTRSFSFSDIFTDAGSAFAGMVILLGINLWYNKK